MLYKIFFFILFTISCTKNTTRFLGEEVITKEAKPQTFQKIAPLTTNNFKSRKNLHENGWYFIPSTKKTLNKVSEEGKMTALTAKAMILVSLKKKSIEYPKNLSDRMDQVSEVVKKYDNSMQKLSSEIYSGTTNLIFLEAETSSKFFSEAKENFIIGYIELVPTSKKDIQNIYSEMKQINSNLKENYKSLDDFFADNTKNNGQKISSAWRSSYSKAILEFDKSFKESGERPNSLLAVWDIFQGYSFALKELALSPLAESTVESGKYVLNGTILTSGYVVNATGQVIYSTGMVFYTPMKLGYRVMSPSLESGYLGALGMATAFSIAPTSIGGYSLGAFNQVTAISTSTTSKAVGYTGGTVYETGNTAAGMFYDIGKETGKTVLYGFKSGVVLGYSALTAIPPHLFLTATDGIIILAWDGPRLVIAKIRGNYEGYEDLPAGTVLDLEEVKKNSEVKILTDDEKIIKDVIEKDIEEKEKMMKEKEKNDK